MDHYNRLISSRVLDNYESMIDKVPQPQMFGGKRVRNYVLPASTEYDYPASLSVGRMDGQHPRTLGEEFYKEFGDGFPTGSLQAGGAGERIVGGKKFNLLKALKPAVPVVKQIGMALAKEGIKQGVKSATKRAGKRKGVIPVLAEHAKKIGRQAAPIVRKAASEVMPVVKKAAHDVLHDVVIPYGKKTAKRIGKKTAKHAVEKYVPEDYRGMAHEFIDKTAGGALIRDDASQFHSSVYPPALASYAHSFPKGHDAYGKGRKPKAVGGARSARGAIVAEVMKKHGLTLPQASKFVKEKNLY